MPFYRYNLDAMYRHAKDVVKSFQSAGVSVKYAVKANPNPKILRTLAGAGVSGFDTSSAGELDGLGVLSQNEVSISGPGKLPVDLVKALQIGALVEVESVTEMRRLEEAADLLDLDSYDYAIRVKPMMEVEGASMDMTDSWFGCNPKEVPEIVETGESGRLVGFHCYPGSQNLNTEGLASYFERVCIFLVTLIDLYVERGVSSPYANVGGGLGVPYHARQEPVDLEPIIESLGSSIREITNKRLDKPEIGWQIELGRYLVAEYGEYVVNVIDFKEAGGKKYAVTDGGMHQHAAASGNLGQMFPRNYPTRADRSSTNNSSEYETVTVVGCLCTPIDVLARDIRLPRLSLGDQIVIEMSGAYALSASPVHFLGHPMPGVVYKEVKEK